LYNGTSLIKPLYGPSGEMVVYLNLVTVTDTGPFDPITPEFANKFGILSSDDGLVITGATLPSEPQRSHGLIVSTVKTRSRTHSDGRRYAI